MVPTNKLGPPTAWNQSRGLFITGKDPAMKNTDSNVGETSSADDHDAVDRVLAVLDSEGMLPHGVSLRTLEHDSSDLASFMARLHDRRADADRLNRSFALRLIDAVRSPNEQPDPGNASTWDEYAAGIALATLDEAGPAARRLFDAGNFDGAWEAVLRCRSATNKLFALRRRSRDELAREDS